MIGTFLFLSLVLFSAIASADSEKCRNFPAPGFDGPDMVRHTGVYTNPNYGYSVRILDGLTGYSDPPPSLHHGFGIVLSWEPHAYFYFDGSYDVLDEKTATNVERKHLKRLREESAHILRVRKLHLTLASVPAQRYVARIKCKNRSGVFIEDKTFAVREGVVYTAGLLTTEERYLSDVAVLETMLKSWKWTRIE